MDVQMRPLSAIQPYPDNPRHNDEAVAAVAASIHAFGFRQPIVVDEHGVIIVGHTRYKAALQLEWTEVPVHVACGLTPDQTRAYRIADNQTATQSRWDEDALVRELLALRDTGFDLALTSFSNDELDTLLASSSPDPLADPDDVPDPPAEPVTQLGDVWALGRHRLLCGDATEPAVLARVLDGRSADLLLTDPPYNVAYTGKTADRLTLANDALDDRDYRTFLTTALTTAVAHLPPGAGFYIWHADTYGLTVRLAAADAGLTVRQVLVWAKSAFALGRQDYHWQHEPCLYGWRDGAAHNWLGGRDQSTLLAYDRPARNADHPTTKPTALFEQLIANSCPPGGVVLDPFAGSGTTVLAAETQGRTAAVVELDPRYADVIVRRYEQFTGQQAERVVAGTIPTEPHYADPDPFGEVGAGTHEPAANRSVRNPRSGATG